MASTITFTSATATKSPTRPTYQKMMSVTQKYMIAHQARGKLAKEAKCPDHNLHRLVCHANMLDTLIFDLARAEEEQEIYLNRLTYGERKPAKKSKKEKCVRLVVKKLEEGSKQEDEQDLSDSELSSDEESEPWQNIAPAKTNDIVVISLEGQQCADELQEEDARLTLVRTKSHLHPSLSEHSKSASISL